MATEEKIKVIAIDDEAMNLEIIETYFSIDAVASLYELQVAQTYAEAEDLLQKLSMSDRVALLVDENLAAKQKTTRLVEYARQKIQDLLVVCTSNGPIELEKLSDIVTFGEYPEILAGAVIAFANEGVDRAKNEYSELLIGAKTKSKKLTK